MINIPRGNYDDIFSNIIFFMILNDHFACDRLHIRDVPENGKSDLLLFEDTSMSDFDSSFKRLSFSRL